MRAVYLVLGLGEGLRAGLAVGRHGELVVVVATGRRHAVVGHDVLLLRRQPRRAIAMLLRMRHYRAELVLQVLDVERVGQFGELLGRVMLVAGRVVNREVEVEVEVDEVAEVVLGGSAHGVELLCAGPCCSASVVDVHHLQWAQVLETEGSRREAEKSGFLFAAAGGASWVAGRVRRGLENVSAQRPGRGRDEKTLEALDAVMEGRRSRVDGRSRVQGFKGGIRCIAEAVPSLDVHSLHENPTELDKRATVQPHGRQMWLAGMASRRRPWVRCLAKKAPCAPAG